jgi:hypothetical protein
MFGRGHGKAANRTSVPKQGSTVIAKIGAYSRIMSKLKTPMEKKRIILVKHRRNVYGECPTSSRKNISRGKQRGHMEVRRAANEELRSLKGASTEVLDCSIVGLSVAAGDILRVVREGPYCFHSVL